MTNDQHLIMKYVDFSGYITTAQVARLFPCYHNSRHYASQRLSRMVRQGYLVRVKPGRFERPARIEEPQELELS